MPKFKIIFDGYEEPDEYDTYEEAEEAADEMASNFQLGAELLCEMNPGGYLEDYGGDDGSYVIIEVDDDGNEIDRY